MLDWLNRQWTKLKDWVENGYETVMGWVRARLGDFVNYLRDTLYNLINTFNSWMAWLKGRIEEVAANARSDLTSWWNNVVASITNVYNVVRQWIIDQFNNAVAIATNIRDWLVGQLNNVVSWAQNLWNQVQPAIERAISGITGWISARINEVINLANTIYGTVKGWIDGAAAELRGWVNQLTTKIENVQALIPVVNAGVIWGYVESYFTAWFEWWLAVLLNNGQDELPAKPTLPGGAYGGNGQVPGGQTPGASGFIWPTSSRYISGYRFTSVHKGVDIGIGMGDPIVAVQGGTVVNAGWSDVGYGFMVRLTHPNGWHSLYAHLMQPTVVTGQTVTQGQVIGIGDSTGHSTGPHLHLEIYQNSTYFDPLTLLP